MKAKIAGLIIIVLLLPAGIASLIMDEENFVYLIRSIYFLPKKIIYHNGITKSKKYVCYLSEKDVLNLNKYFFNYNLIDPAEKDHFNNISIIKDTAFLNRLQEKLSNYDLDTTKIYSVYVDKINNSKLLKVELMFNNDYTYSVTLSLIRQSGEWRVCNILVYGDPHKCIVNKSDLEAMEIYDLLPPK